MENSEAKPPGNIAKPPGNVANIPDMDSKEISEQKRKYDSTFPMEELQLQSGVKRLCTEKNKSANNAPAEKVKSSFELMNAVMLQREIVENIFSFLDIHHQIQLERVCLQWRRIGKDCFWRRIKKLDLRPYIRDRSARFTTDAAVEGILARCSRDLEQITFTDTRLKESIYEYLNSILRSLHLIAQSCPNLVQINCYHASITNEALLLLAEECPNLETLILESSTRFDIKGLTTFATLCKTLRSLQVSSTHDRNSDYFNVCINQNTNLRFLRIYPDAILLTTEAIEILFDRLYYLEEIHLPGCIHLWEEPLAKLFNRCGSKIKELYFERMLLFSSAQTKWYEGLCLLSNLIRLSLRDMRVNDTVCSILANNCMKLEHVDIRASDVTDSGLCHLSTLPNLKILDVSLATNIISTGIVTIAKRGKLEKLFLGECDLLEADVGCSSLASFCPNLKFLDFSYLSVSDVVVSEFVKAIESGFMNGPVHILVYGSDIHPSVDICQKLHLEFTNQY